jgi:hypothetical protein
VSRFRAIIRTGRGRIRTVAAPLALLSPAVALGNPLGGDPWADEVMDYVQGSNVNPSYTDSATVLGSPERFTGETDFGGDFAAAVTMFNAPFGTDELLSIGTGGFLEVRFAEPITNDPANPFGFDLIVFGNGFFVDDDYPNGQFTDPAAYFDDDPMEVLVSADGAAWVSLGTFAEGFFPTQGYTDVAPQFAPPGSVPTNFRKPMDPALTLSSFDGLTYEQALTLYDGAGGGAAIDVAPAGLPEIRFVRIENNTPGVQLEIDAFSTVPEPASLTLMLLGLVGTALWRES